MTLVSRIAVPAVALAIIAGAATSGFANSTPRDLQCGIATTTKGGMLTIQGVVLSPADVGGEYSFSLRSRNGGSSSDNSQGGAFAARADTPTMVGQVSLNAGARYDLDFTVTVDGKRIDCNSEFKMAL